MKHFEKIKVAAEKWGAVQTVVEGVSASVFTAFGGYWISTGNPVMVGFGSAVIGVEAAYRFPGLYYATKNLRAAARLAKRV